MHPLIKKRILNTLKEIQPKQSNKSILADAETLINYIEAIIHFKEAETELEISQNLGYSFSQTSLLIACLIDMSSALENESIKPIPMSWTVDNKGPNPNWVLHSICLSMSNMSKSALILLQKGFDGPARILTRQIIEASWLAKVIAVIPEKMNEYVKHSGDENKEYASWKKNFSPSQIQNSLTEVDKVLYENNSLQASKSKDQRLKEYSFYSNSVHHSYTYTALHSFSFNPKTEVGEKALGGAYTVHTKNNIRALNTNLLGFLFTIILIFKKIHHFKLSDGQGFWKTTSLLYLQCVVCAMDEGVSKDSDIIKKVKEFLENDDDNQLTFNLGFS